MEAILRLGRRIIPERIFRMLQPAYHYSLALLSAICYGFPAKRIKVFAVTGTKGKSSTVELVNAIFEAAGHRSAILGTIRFKIADHSEPNLHKMTMPGRFFVQKFLRDAVNAKCEYAIIEMTSEGAKQFRHTFIDLDALLFLNLAPEHIESHGSYEAYRDVKLSLAQALAHSPKKTKVLVVNGDDPEASKFMEAAPGTAQKVFSMHDAMNLTLGASGLSFELYGVTLSSKLRGRFNVYNILAAATLALSQGVSMKDVEDGIANVKEIRGRVESISVSADQAFEVIVDYAHTPHSLEALYGAFPGKKKICVLGNTGGGRDRWKRPEMARIAEANCERVILTNEDPYDEDPRSIVEEMSVGMKKKPIIILDRREAIQEALQSARRGDVILITGKGTDPYIMGPKGSKILWDDATVVRQELDRFSVTAAGVNQ